MNYSSKFIYAVKRFLSPGEPINGGWENSFYKKVIVSPKINDSTTTLTIPLCSTHFLLEDYNIRKYKTAEAYPIISCKRFTEPTVNTAFTRYISSPADDIVEYNVKGNKYYIGRGLLADDNNIYVLVENTYAKKDNEDVVCLVESVVYLNNNIYVINNEVTKFILSRLLPCINNFKIQKSRYNAHFMDGRYELLAIDFFYNNFEGPCSDIFKMCYICNSEMNKKFVVPEAPNIQSFSNEELLSNIIKYVNKL